MGLSFKVHVWQYKIFVHQRLEIWATVRPVHNHNISEVILKEKRVCGVDVLSSMQDWLGFEGVNRGH